MSCGQSARPANGTRAFLRPGRTDAVLGPGRGIQTATVGKSRVRTIPERGHEGRRGNATGSRNANRRLPQSRIVPIGSPKRSLEPGMTSDGPRLRQPQSLGEKWTKPRHSIRTRRQASLPTVSRPRGAPPPREGEARFRPPWQLEDEPAQWRSQLFDRTRPAN